MRFGGKLIYFIFCLAEILNMAIVTPNPALATFKSAKLL